MNEKNNFFKKANIYVYHLLSPVNIVAKILDKAFLNNNKILFACGDAVSFYDQKLWSYEQISFLPHTSIIDERNKYPIFITNKTLQSDNENMLMLLDTHSDHEALNSYETVCDVFQSDNSEPFLSNDLKNKVNMYEKLNFFVTIWFKSNNTNWIKIPTKE